MIDLLWPSVQRGFYPFTRRLEGAIPWLYQDILGLVTIACGVLVDTPEQAARLPLVHVDGQAATRDEIRDEWERVKAAKGIARAGARAAKAYTTLHLTDADVERVTMGKLATMMPDLVQRFPAFAAWPAGAQLFGLSMLWALGRWWATHPKCAEHMDHLDLLAARDECTIRESGNPGVVPRNVANRKLLEQAARAIGGQGDVTALVLP